MMLLIAFDFYFYTFLLQSFFEDHQVANFQPLSTESSFAINLNITRLLCRYKVKLSVLKVKNQSVILLNGRNFAMAIAKYVLLAFVPLL